MKVRQVSYFFVREHKLYVLQGLVLCNGVEKDLAPEMAKYGPVFEQAANFIVINNRH